MIDETRVPQPGASRSPGGDGGLAERLRANRVSILSRVVAAARRAGRDPGAVTLVAVTKSVGPEVTRALATATDARDLGENRVAAALEKKGALGDLVPPVRWHLIGHLQTNKAKKAVESFDVIHSVDSSRLAAAVDQAAAASGRSSVDILIQVNVSGESTKSGFTPEALPDALDGVLALPRLRALGLMTMAPLDADPEASRPHFRALREIAERESRRRGLPPLALSMGMTQDYEVAVEEGATHLRVGTALFEGVGG